MSGKTIMQSYVHHRSGKSFFVSTADRDSSAAAAFGSRYAETIVWEWDAEKRELGRLMFTDSSPKGTIGRHQQICAELFENGAVEDRDD